MNYEIAFWVLLAIIITRIISTTTIYIGSDEQKYKAANIGILLRKQREL